MPGPTTAMAALGSLHSTPPSDGSTLAGAADKNRGSIAKTLLRRLRRSVVDDDG